MIETTIKNQRLIMGDTFDGMATLPDGSVDMVLCDLPYGTTQNKWDSIIPLNRLWAEYWRVCKPNAAIVLTAQVPFDKMLGASQIEHLKYEWIWQKESGTGHLNAKKQPLKDHENVLVFYRSQCVYNPQKTFGHKAYVTKKNGPSSNYGSVVPTGTDASDGSRYPRAVQKFNRDKGFHPTQKPVALFEYLIRTYTNPGETVLDNTAGSMTTAVAAYNTGRKSVCIERDHIYYMKGLQRVVQVCQ